MNSPGARPFAVRREPRERCHAPSRRLIASACATHTLSMVVVGLATFVTPTVTLSDDYTTLGAGTALCGRWTDAHKSRNALLAGAFNQWILGYLTAFNVWKVKDLVSNTDNSGILEWVSNYCADHPLERVDNAALALVVELTERMAKRHSDQ
jgi:hypothetical protein